MKWRLVAFVMAMTVFAAACGKPEAETTKAPETAALFETKAPEQTQEEKPVVPVETIGIPTTAVPETTVQETTVPETTVPETTAPEFDEVEETVYATDNVNIRKAASKESESLGQLREGKSVTRTGVGTEWSRVEYEGQICYIASEYLTTEKPAAPTFSGGTGIYHAGGDILVCIDAGHQNYGMSEKEPNGPGSDIMKAKVTSGTDGVSTGVAEHVVNLKVALLLRDELLARGYSVIMTRETGDVELSNIMRAEIANNSGADIMVRIHCNSSDSSKTRGALGICQTAYNEYIGHTYDECVDLTNAVLKGYCGVTGLKNTGIWETDTMTGTNWCEVPNTIIEMGYMSNPTEDELLCDSDFQKQAAEGIADGIDIYFGR